MPNRFTAAALIALGVLGIVVSLQIWQPCYESAVSARCLDLMDARAHWPFAFVSWIVGIVVAVVAAFSAVGRWASLVAIVLLLVVANPTFDPGIGTWDTADTAPGSGIISASWLVVAGIIIGVGGLIDLGRMRVKRSNGSVASAHPSVS